MTLLHDGEVVATTATDADGRYCFADEDFDANDGAFTVQVDLDARPGKSLGSINRLNTLASCGQPEVPDTELCGAKDVGAGTIVVDFTPILDGGDGCRSFVEGIDFVLCEPPPQLCWLTAGGVKFDRTSDMWSAECRPDRGPVDTVGGVAYPSCSPDPGNGGNWNHVGHSLNLHLLGQDIRVLRCGNIDGIDPGTESPVCAVNFIEFVGTGVVQGVHGNQIERTDVTFFVRAEDHNEPGNEQSANSGEDIDRYFLRVEDGAGTVLILVDEDGDQDTVDPLTITGGNFKIHCTSCEDGAGASLGRLQQEQEIGGVFLRGDANTDGTVDLSDGLFALDNLFLGGSRPLCADAGDSNDDGLPDMSDVVYSFAFLFSGGSDFPAPHLEPWLDPSPDFLTCMR